MAMRGRAEEARRQGVLDKRDGPVGRRTWDFDRCRQCAEGDGLALAGLNERERQGVPVHVFSPHCYKNIVRHVSILFVLNAFSNNPVGWWEFEEAASSPSPLPVIRKHAIAS